MTNRSLDDLELLAAKAGSGFNRDFGLLHHFSRSPPFSTAPSTFAVFLRYCRSLSRGIQPGQENDQTIQRAHRYLSLVSQGAPPASALRTAWHEFPLVSRA